MEIEHLVWGISTHLLLIKKVEIKCFKTSDLYFVHISCYGKNRNIGTLPQFVRTENIRYLIFLHGRKINTLIQFQHLYYS